MKLALPFLVRDVLPLPPDQALLDFYPLEDPGKNETVVGLLIAAPKEPGDGHDPGAVERAGLLVHRRRPRMLRGAAFRPRSSPKTPRPLSTSAPNTTNFVIHMDGDSAHRADDPARRQLMFTKTMEPPLGMSIAQAEALKCRVGLVMGEGPPTSPKSSRKASGRC